MKLPPCFTVFDSILKTHTNDTNTSQLLYTATWLPFKFFTKSLEKLIQYV